MHLLQLMNYPITGINILGYEYNLNSQQLSGLFGDINIRLSIKFILVFLQLNV